MAIQVTPTFGLKSVLNTASTVAGAISTPKTPIANQNPDTPSPTFNIADILQNKSKNQYSNKQFIAPFLYSQNVEGTFIHVDYLGKRIVTSGSQPYRSIASLSAAALPITLINNPAIINPTTLVKAISTGAPVPKGTPAENAAVQIFGTGSQAVTQSLAGITTPYTSQQQVPSSQLFSNLASSGVTALAGQLQGKLPFTSINQQIANLPGFSVVTGALGQLPGGNNIVGALTNPVGAATGAAADLLKQTFSASLDIQGGLPSVSLGSLGDALNVATSLANSGPPTSLTGVIALEKQLKGIICDFQLPVIAGIDFNALIHFKFHKPDDILKNLKKQLDDLKSKIVNALDISKQLKNLEESIKKEIKKTVDKIVKELTTCEDSPTSKKNAKAGKPSAPAPASPSLVPPTPVQTALAPAAKFSYNPNGTNTVSGPAGPLA